eukprot:14293-Heterococcus_DN1.PRE.1
MSSTMRAATSTACTLQDAGILLHVLNILGPGHHLFISAVSKAWRESCKRLANARAVDLTYDFYDEVALSKITHQTTLCSAAFESVSRVEMAHECGLTFNNTRLQRIVGRSASALALQAARDLGLQFSEEVLFGAAEAASIPKLQWSHLEQGCPLHDDVTFYAAKSGSIDTLRWLRDHGCLFQGFTCDGAAAGAHMHLLQFLRDEGCVWEVSACSAAARHGHLPTLQWLHEQGCPWQQDEICYHAAECGSIEMLVYLKQQGCQYNALTLYGAASEGHLNVCQYLVAEQCPCDDITC